MWCLRTHAFIFYNTFFQLKFMLLICLKELNKELTRKLEAQTQRLELLTTQSMTINNNAQPRRPNTRAVHENIPYADEGDEVIHFVDFSLFLFSLQLKHRMLVM